MINNFQLYKKFMNKKFLNIICFVFFLTSFFNNVYVIDHANATDPVTGSITGTTGTGDDNAITKVLCNVVDFLTGSVAKGVGIIAIVVVAVGLFMGKFSWGVGLATALGIAMIFGAQSVVTWLAKGIGSAATTKLC